MANKETKMIQKRTFIGTLLIGGCIPLIASAQTDKAGQTPRPAQAGAQTGAQTDPMKGEQGRFALQRSDKIIGADVMDQSGTKIARIDDLIINADGTIGYAIVSGTEPDTMAKEYPIPWKLVKVDMAGSNTDRSAEPKAGADRGMTADRYTLTVDKARLAQAPSFDRTQWPKGADSVVYTDSDRFFGNSAVAGNPDSRSGRPVEAGAANATYFRASQLRNQSVNDAAGMPIGTLGQVVIDPAQGRVNYVTFSTTSTAGATGRTVALPWQTMRASQRDQKDRFELTVPQDRLQGAPEFQNGDENWKRMSDQNYVRDVYGYYSVRPYWNDTSSGKGTPDTKGKDDGGRDNSGHRKDGGDTKNGGGQTGNDPKRGNTGGNTGGTDTGGQSGGNTPPHRN